MARLAKQIGQVLTTYLMRPRIWWVSLFSFVGMLYWISFARSSKDDSIHMGELFATAFYLILPVAYLSYHIYGQFCHPRARLTPRFAAAHLIAFAALLAVIVLLPTFIVGFSNAKLGLQIATVQVLGIGLDFIITIYTRIIWLMLVPFYAYLLFGSVVWDQQIALSPLTCGGVLLLAGIVCLRFGYWLTTLREEDAAYQSSIYETKGLGRMRAGRTQNWMAHDFLNEGTFRSKVFDRWFDWLTRSDRRKRDIQRLRLGFGATPTELPASVAFFLAIGLTAFILFWNSNEWSGDGVLPILLIGSFFSSFMPGAAASDAMVKRRTQLAMEILWPMSRRQLISKMLQAAGWNAAEWWLSLTFATLIVYGIVSGPGPGLSLIVAFALFSLAAAIAAYGLSVYSALWTHVFERLIVLVMAVIAYGLVVGFWLGTRDQNGDLPLLIIAAILVPAGVALINAARNAWLNAELG